MLEFLVDLFSNHFVVGGRTHFPTMPKAKALPWKIAPKAPVLYPVGSEEYGVIEVPKKGSLTVNEAQFIRENTKELPNLQERVMQIATEIAKDEGITFVEAFEALTSGASTMEVVLPVGGKKGDEQFAVEPLKKDIPKGAAFSYEDETILVTEEAKAGDEVLYVEALPDAIGGGEKILVSLPSKVAQNNAVKLMKFQQESAEISPVRNAVLATAMLRRVMGSDWSINQTSDEVPMKVIDDLAEFCTKEMNGWAEDKAEADEPVTEETLKNG